MLLFQWFINKNAKQSMSYEAFHHLSVISCCQCQHHSSSKKENIYSEHQGKL